MSVGVTDGPGLIRQRRDRGQLPTEPGLQILRTTAVASPSASDRQRPRPIAGSGPVWPEFVAHHLQIGLRNYAVGGGACARHRRSTDAHSDLRQSARPRASKLTFADDLVQGHTCVVAACHHAEQRSGYGDLSIPAPSMLDQVGRYVDDEHRSKCVRSPGAPDAPVIHISRSSR